jgi:SAM-dependent methyltransferase
MPLALTDKNYWIDHYGSTPFVKYGMDNDHFNLLFSFADRARIRTVIEVGSFPGPFLAALGDCGFELNGIDFHPRNSTDLPRWLQSQGFLVGDFHSAEFNSVDLQRKFDLVYSIGFIEHFTDFDKVILRHADMVGPNGYLFISAPNFSGIVQRWLHRFLDKENLDKHFLPSMDPLLWADILRRNGFEVLFAGHHGRLGFWVDPAERRSRTKRLIVRFVVRLFWNIKKIYKQDSRHFSAHCGVIAVRRA